MNRSGCTGSALAYRCSRRPPIPFLTPHLMKICLCTQRRLPLIFRWRRLMVTRMRACMPAVQQQADPGRSATLSLRSLSGLRSSGCFRDGEGGIRTHGGFRLAGFQDRSHQPLDHLSRGLAQMSRPNYFTPTNSSAISCWTRETGLHGGGGVNRVLLLPWLFSPPTSLHCVRGSWLI